MQSIFGHDWNTPNRLYEQALYETCQDVVSDVSLTLKELAGLPINIPSALYRSSFTGQCHGKPTNSQ